MSTQTGTAAPSLLGVTVARQMNEPVTNSAVSRMVVAVVHT
ncbi:hypothetical protein [Paracoccus yeei]|nr:hypothetical protein [Paracoccus yeei]